MTYFTQIQLISPGFGALFADEALFHFDRRSRRFAQIKDPALIAITHFV